LQQAQNSRLAAFRFYKQGHLVESEVLGTNGSKIQLAPSGRKPAGPYIHGHQFPIALQARSDVRGSGTLKPSLLSSGKQAHTDSSGRTQESHRFNLPRRDSR
jgi:hypothetical protein